MNRNFELRQYDELAQRFHQSRVALLWMKTYMLSESISDPVVEQEVVAALESLNNVELALHGFRTRCAE
jgi:hypothetical protein